MEERKLTCIGCPMGCPLTVVMNGKEVVGVTGNTCKRGDSVTTIPGMYSPPFHTLV